MPFYFGPKYPFTSGQKYQQARHDSWWGVGGARGGVTDNYYTTTFPRTTYNILPLVEPPLLHICQYLASDSTLLLRVEGLDVEVLVHATCLTGR